MTARRPPRSVGCASMTLLALFLLCAPAGAAERWSGTMTRLGWDLFERQLPSPDEPVAFSYSSGARTISGFTATVREYCEQPGAPVWEPEVVEDDGSVTPGYWDTGPGEIVKRMRPLRQTGRVSVARNGTFAVGSGTPGTPGSWRFTGRLKTDQFGNIEREVVGPALIADSVEGCTQDGGLRRTDPHWIAHGPPLPRPRIGVSVARKAPAIYRVTIRVMDRRGRAVPRARVWFAPEPMRDDPEWTRRKADRTGRVTFTAGPGRTLVSVGGHGVGPRGCTLTILDWGRKKDTC